MTLHILFLDANVLISAASYVDARLRRLWGLSTARLVMSHYAATEARRTSRDEARRVRLDELLEMTKIVTAPRHLEWAADLGIHLPKKDRPILLASIEVGATYLLTGDYRHFGRFYGRPIRGVTILSPRDYLATAKD